MCALFHATDSLAGAGKPFLDMPTQQRRFFLPEQGSDLQQDIFRLPDEKPVVRARVEAVCTIEGRLADYAPLMDIFGKYLQ